MFEWQQYTAVMSPSRCSLGLCTLNIAVLTTYIDYVDVPHHAIPTHAKVRFLHFTCKLRFLINYCFSRVDYTSIQQQCLSHHSSSSSARMTASVRPDGYLVTVSIIDLLLSTQAE